jgi:hypothetical protein
MHAGDASGAPCLHDAITVIKTTSTRSLGIVPSSSQLGFRMLSSV